LVLNEVLSKLLLVEQRNVNDPNAALYTSIFKPPGQHHGGRGGGSIVVMVVVVVLVVATVKPALGSSARRRDMSSRTAGRNLAERTVGVKSKTHKHWPCLLQCLLLLALSSLLTTGCWILVLPSMLPTWVMTS
jgi:hypothetical protein